MLQVDKLCSIYSKFTFQVPGPVCDLEDMFLAILNVDYLCLQVCIDIVNNAL